MLNRYDRLSNETARDLAIDLRPFLAHSQVAHEHWEAVEQDLRQGRAAIRLGLEVKFDWTQRLPWVLAGLAAEDVSIARRIGRSAVALYDGQSAALRPFHLPTTIRFLSQQSSLCAQLDRFLTGEALWNLVELLEEVFTFAMMPIVERYIEGGHAKIQQSLRGKAYKSRSCVLMSLARRLPAIMAVVEEQPDQLGELAHHFDRAHRVFELPDMLQLPKHPEIAHVMCNRPRRQHKLLAMLRQVLYRADTGTMLHPVSAAKQANETSKRKREQAAAKATGIHADTVSRDNIVLAALMDHFRVVVAEQPDSYFTLQGSAQYH